MFKSIRFRSVFYFALILTFILSSTAYLLYDNAYTNRISNIDGSLRVVISDMVHDEEEHAGKIDMDELSDDMQELEEKFQIPSLHVRFIKYDLTTNRETILVESLKAKEAVFADHDFAGGHIPDDDEEDENDDTDGIHYETVDGYRTAMQLIKIDETSLLLIQTSVAISLQDESLRQTLVILAFVNTIIFVFSLFGAYFLITKTLLPVHKIVITVNAIEAYDYTKRISAAEVPNEIRELVDTFNRLLARHKESFYKTSQFSSDASHELKTPLTVIRGEIEVGLRKQRTQKEYQEILDNILAEIIKIQHLIDGLLFLAKTDKLEIRSTFEDVYLDEIVAESVDELTTTAQRKSIELETVHLLPVTIKANATLLKIVCVNLLKNAILYSPEGSDIQISLKEESSQFILSIQDHGVGMMEEELKHIFDRFYRVDKTKSRSSGGTGLGLSIVKMILDIHDLTISFKSALDKGTLVEIFIQKP